MALTNTVTLSLVRIWKRVIVIKKSGLRDGSNLLRRDIVGLGAHVNLLVNVDAGDDEEDARSSGSAGEKATQAEDDSTFIFLLGQVFK